MDGRVNGSWGWNLRPLRLNGNRGWIFTQLALVLLVLLALSLAWGQKSAAGKPVILEFSRLACPVCAKVEAALKEVQTRYHGQMEVRILHIDQEERLFKEYGISFVPTQVFLDADGKEVLRNEGPISLEQLIRKLKELHWIQD